MQYPLRMQSSSSEMRSCANDSACPSHEASNVSSPSRLLSELTSVAPVAFAIRFRSTYSQGSFM